MSSPILSSSLTQEFVRDHNPEAGDKPSYNELVALLIRYNKLLLQVTETKVLNQNSSNDANSEIESLINDHKKLLTKNIRKKMKSGSDENRADTANCEKAILSEVVRILVSERQKGMETDDSRSIREKEILTEGDMAPANEIKDPYQKMLYLKRQNEQIEREDAPLTKMVSERFNTIETVQIQEAKIEADKLRSSMEGLDTILNKQKIQQDLSKEQTNQSGKSLERSISHFSKVLREEKGTGQMYSTKMSEESSLLPMPPKKEELPYEQFPGLQAFQMRRETTDHELPDDTSFRAKLQKRLRRKQKFVEKVRHKKNRIKKFKDLFLDDSASDTETERSRAQRRKKKNLSRRRRKKREESVDRHKSLGYSEEIKKFKKRINRKKQRSRSSSGSFEMVKKKRPVPRKSRLFDRMKYEESPAPSPRFARNWDDTDLINAWAYEKREAHTLLKKSRDLSERFQKVDGKFEEKNS